MFLLLVTLLRKSFCGEFTTKFYVMMFKMLFWCCLNPSQQHLKHPGEKPRGVGGLEARCFQGHTWYAQNHENTWRIHVYTLDRYESPALSWLCDILREINIRRKYSMHVTLMSRRRRVEEG